MPRIDKSMETESRLAAAREGLWDVTTNGCGVSFWSDENVLKLIMVTVMQFCDYNKNK